MRWPSRTAGVNKYAERVPSAQTRTSGQRRAQREAEREIAAARTRLAAAIEDETERPKDLP